MPRPKIVRNPTRGADAWRRKRALAISPAPVRCFFAVVGGPEQGLTIVRLDGAAARAVFLRLAAANGVDASAIDRYERHRLLVAGVMQRTATWGPELGDFSYTDPIMPLKRTPKKATAAYR